MNQMDLNDQRDRRRDRLDHMLLRGRRNQLPSLPEQTFDRWNNVVAEMKSYGKSKYVEHPDKTIVMATKDPKQMKKGGLVKKTAVYKLHKGEVVVPASRVKSVDAALKKYKKKPLKK